MGRDLARVELKNVVKRFGDVIAVNNVDLEVKDREFMVLLGPSGCGKTTILRCISGLEVPDEGEIYIGDTLVNDLPPKDRDIAMVFQSYALYPHMTVFDNIAFPLRMHKFPKDEIRKKVKHTTELLRISHLIDRKPKELSGGEAQRTALGRAIIREPKVFLMDEPLSNLDAKLRVHMRTELKRLQKDIETTTIYVTHDQVEAMTMADRIAIMNYGKLQQLASPDEIYTHPNNLFVASFIGSPPMNFVDITFVEKGEKASIDAGSFTLLIPDTIKDLIKQQATGSELVLGFRPTDVSIHNKRTREECIQGSVYVIEPLGPKIIVDLKIGENIFKVETTADFRADIGDELWLSFDMNKIHIFDKKTEETIV